MTIVIQPFFKITFVIILLCKQIYLYIYGIVHIKNFSLGQKCYSFELLFFFNLSLIYIMQKTIKYQRQFNKINIIHYFNKLMFVSPAVVLSIRILFALFPLTDIIPILHNPHAHKYQYISRKLRYYYQIQNIK